MLFRKTPTRQEKLLEQFSLEVKTELEALVDVLAWFEQVAQNLLSPQCKWQCKLALTEGFTNTVRYAHHNLPSTTPINLEVNVFSRYLEIRIYDQGEPFDLQSQLRSLHQRERNQKNSLEKEGDRGLFFMEKLTDDLQYLRLSNQRNCLVMRKNIADNF